jgi:hypothetical protein
MKSIFAIILCLFLTGCINQHTWVVGESKSKIHLLTYEGLAGPNVTSMWAEDAEGKLTPVYNASGTGLAPSMVSGGSQVGSAYYIGKGLEKSGDNVDNSSSSDSNSDSNSTSQGGAGGSSTNTLNNSNESRVRSTNVNLNANIR